MLRDPAPRRVGRRAARLRAATAFLDSKRDAWALWTLRAAEGDHEGTRDLLRTDPACAARQTDPRVLEVLALTTLPVGPFDRLRTSDNVRRVDFDRCGFAARGGYAVPRI